MGVVSRLDRQAVFLLKRVLIYSYVV